MNSFLKRIQNISGKIPTRGGIRMVPPLDNDTINSRSQYDNDSLTPGEALIEILREHENIVHGLRRNQIDVNGFGDDPASGTVSVTNPVRKPVLLTDIIATWTPQGIANGGVTGVGTGSQTSPAALTAIATTAPVAAGTYLVYINFNLAGTVAQAVDANNIQFTFGGRTIGLTNNIGTNQQNYGPFLITSNASGSAVVRNVALATVGSIYEATITLVPQPFQGGSAILTFGGRTMQLPYATGSYQAIGINGLQWEYNGAAGNNMILTVTPICPVHLEFAGSADYKKVERI